MGAAPADGWPTAPTSCSVECDPTNAYITAQTKLEAVGSCQPDLNSEDGAGAIYDRCDMSALPLRCVCVCVCSAAVLPPRQCLSRVSPQVRPALRGGERQPGVDLDRNPGWRAGSEHGMAGEPECIQLLGETYATASLLCVPTVFIL